MKKVFILIAVCFSLTSYGQRVVTSNSINTGASDTVSYETGTPGDIFFGGSWSYQLDYRDFDDVDATLGLYYSDFHPDSSVKTLLFFDDNLDGTNDNPFTLSDTAGGSFFKWGREFPGRYFIRVLTRVSVSDSTTANELIIKQ